MYFASIYFSDIIYMVKTDEKIEKKIIYCYNNDNISLCIAIFE